MVSAPPVATGSDEPSRQRSTRSRRARRVWLAVRLLVMAGLAYVGVLVVVSNSAELSGAASYLRHANGAWIAAAVLAEALSYGAFTQLQRVLLASGGLRTKRLPMVGITLAGNAINTTIPGGGAFATIFAYRQFRRRGADEALTTWTLVAIAALASVALALLAVVGLLVAGEDGPVGGLWPLIAVLVAGPVLAMAVLVRPRLLLKIALPGARRLARRMARPASLVGRLVGRLRGAGGAALAPDLFVLRLVERLEAVTPGARDWLWGATFALGNWVADCSCLILASQAVGAPVPWRGVLVAYGAAQVAANLPITPGGLGVVEGSLTVALVAYGGSTAGTVAAVLVYRIISFWALLPLGWLAYLGLHLEARQHPDVAPGIVAAVEQEIGTAAGGDPR